MRKIIKFTLIPLLALIIVQIPSSYAFADNFGIPEIAGQPEKISLPVIMYHSTSPKNPNMYNITPQQLENDFIWLAEKGYTPITVSDLIKFTKGRKLPKKPVMLTFDDGYANNYYNVFPLLKKYNIRCVMSVIGRLTDDNYDKDGSCKPKMSHVTYEQIKKMHDSGYVEIQNHTFDLHHTKSRRGMKKCRGESCDTYETLIKNDLLKLHNKLMTNCGINCTAVAFPYGYYDKETVDIVKDIGYKAAFTCYEKLNIISPDQDFFILNRYNRPSGKTTSAFFTKLNVC